MKTKNVCMTMVCASVLFAAAGYVRAEVISFTGGTIDGGLVTDTTFQGVGNIYEEGAYRFEYLGGTGHFGAYYGPGNDVAHFHPLAGDAPELRISRIDNGLFDLNSISIVSNTQQGGGAATGNEIGHMNASYDGSTIGGSVLLVSEDWGGGSTLMAPGAAFTGLQYVSFTADANIFCIGIDDVDMVAVPEPASLGLLGLISGGIYFTRRFFIA